MTAFKAFALVLFILPLAWARFGEHHRVTGLSEDEIDVIFDRADANSRDRTLSGDELPVALNEAVRSIFKYYVDEEMIRAIVEENLQKRVPDHLKRASFGDFLATVPSTVKNFRENIFDYLLRHYDVEGLMEDQEIANEVYKNPDIFGLTHSAYRVLSFNFDQPPNQVPTYTETRTTFESVVKEPENLDKRIQEEINRITESVGEGTVLTDGIISVGKETGGVDTFAENVAHTPGVAIEIDQTITVAVDGVPAEVEVKTEVKATDL